ncbi:L-histidine N(alpha)-methyltransferase [Niveispirillum sp. KHB5.9]|uniref:L-histidine N(alpha)-methyltransferase n=1 Tax=Niveispirillum sp. KHB5.9 TaxID=3400269 RepID=UPI003A8A5840
MPRDIHRIDTQLASFRHDVLSGLSRPRKALPPRWLYDDRGCELFEEITGLPEYYPTRTETAILADNAEEIAEFCGDDAVMLEYGAGAGIKTRIVIEALPSLRLYVPIDIAADFLQLTAERLAKRFPGLRTLPIAGDFTDDLHLPSSIPTTNRFGFFPGSTIGNLDPDEAASFLVRLRRHVGANGRCIIGVDLKKDVGTLIDAYDDSQGVTAAFNLNLLQRINRELGGTFTPSRFRHHAVWNEREGAIEMHLESMVPQTVAVAGRPFRFQTGETIHTESSRKYSVASFTALAAGTGWRCDRVWMDRERKFAVFGLV